MSYSSLLILKSLMHEIWMWENRLADEDEDLDSQLNPATMDFQQNQSMTPGIPRNKVKVPLESDLLPSHYFDFFYGTSSGGIIATLLGRLRMTVDEAMSAYLDITRAMFEQRTRSMLYEHEPMESSTRAIVASKCTLHVNCMGDDLFDECSSWDGCGTDVPLDTSRPRKAQTCCLSTLRVTPSLEKVCPMRTYCLYYPEDFPNWTTRYREGPTRLTITQVLRATTATPMYFRPVVAPSPDGPREMFEVAKRATNPCVVAFSEFKAIYMLDKRPALMLSIGAGHRGATSLRRATWHHRSPPLHMPFPNQKSKAIPCLAWLLQKPLGILASPLAQQSWTYSEETHQQMRENAGGELTWYKRFNIPVNALEVPMDEWQDGTFGSKFISGGATLCKIHGVTMQYLGQKKPASDHGGKTPISRIRDTAEKLVRHRRAREAEGGQRYNVFVGK